MLNSVSFWLNTLPGSVNEIYELNRPDSGLPRRRLKGEWALWVTKQIPWVPKFSISENSIVQVDRCYRYPWFGKNKRWRRVDTPNMDKLLFDLISKAIGVDDHRFKLGMMDSRDSEDGKVQITLTEIAEAQWRTRPDSLELELLLRRLAGSDLEKQLQYSKLMVEFGGDDI